jgi:allantoinase
MAISVEDRWAYSPITTRPTFTWPGGKKLALWIAVNIEHYDFLPERTGAWPRLGSAPDVKNYSHRELSPRVGIWRMFEALDQAGITGSASLNTRVLKLFPAITEALVEREWAIMSHGLVNTSNIHGMTEEQEREFWDETTSLVKEYAGRDLKGMLTPGLSSNDRTPELMVEYGLTYLADPVNDDQPVPMKVEGGGKLIAVPYTYDLNTGVQLNGRWWPSHYAQAVKAQFDQLLADSESAPRIMCISTHPFLLGSAAGARYLDEILEHVTGNSDVWYTTGDDIAEYYLDNCYNAEVAFTTKEVGGA